MTSSNDALLGDMMSLPTLAHSPARGLVAASVATAALVLGGTLAAQAAPPADPGDLSDLSELSEPAAAAAGPTAEVPLRLTYGQPATDWETETLPIGNGALGASIYGGVAQGRLQLNEKSLWSGGPGVAGYDYGNYDRSTRPNSLDDVRAKIEAEGQADPSWVAGKLGKPRTGYGSYQPFGELLLDVPGTEGYEDYERALDLNDAVSTVEYTVDGVTFTREYIASYPDDVIVAHLTADAAGAIDFTATYRSQMNGGTVTAEDGRLTLSGEVPGNGLAYNGQIQVLAEGGSVTDSGSDVIVAGADSATLIFSGGTEYAPVYPDYRAADPAAHVARVTAAVDAAAAQGWDALRAAHEADYHELFDRVALDLQGAPIDVHTDTALSRYTGATDRDRTLETLFFQYGRYLLISSSRDNSPLPANLQGVWNNSTGAPWGADYHTNINLQMNYWPALSTNLAETYTPYVEYIESLVPAGAASAEAILGMDGWMVNNETTPWGFTGVHNYAEAFWFPEANAWLAIDVFRQYLYSGDEGFLAETAYPLLRKTADFWLDYLTVDGRDGSLVASPSYSPEHGPFTAGAAMTQQLATELLTAVVEAGEILDVDASFRDEVAGTLAQLDTGLHVSETSGRILEWKDVAIDDSVNATDPNHRHVSQLYALFPGNAISWAHTPELAEAAEVTLTDRGDGGTGWSKAWKINFWANLGDGSHAHKMLSEQLKNSTYDNLWDAHPPFQIDGNFGAASGVAEMLVQSNADGVEILPALPGAWRDGSVDGLRGAGGLTIGATWANGTGTQLRVTPDASGEVSVRSPLITGPIRVLGAGSPVEVEVADGKATWTGAAGTTYTIEPLTTMGLTGPTSVEQGAQPEVTVTLDGEVAGGTLGLAAGDGWVVGPACTRVEGPGEYTFTIAVPEDAAPGSATVTVTYATPDGTVTRDLDLTVVPSTRTRIDQAELTVAASSWQEASEYSHVDQAVDGDPDTIWHSQWSQPEPDKQPWLSVDLGSEYSEITLNLLPRQSGNTNGQLEDYRVYVSEDGATWEAEAVASGTMPNNRDLQSIELPPEVTTEHVKIVWLSSYSDTSANFGSLAELNVNGVNGETPDPLPPLEVDPGTCDVVETPTITDVTGVEPVILPYGTSESDAGAALPAATTITDSDGTDHDVALTWDISDYDGTVAADYTATGSFELPDGVAQSDPATVLEVVTVVTVSPQGADGSDNTGGSDGSDGSDDTDGTDGTDQGADTGADGTGGPDDTDGSNGTEDTDQGAGTGGSDSGGTTDQGSGTDQGSDAGADQDGGAASGSDSAGGSGGDPIDDMPDTGVSSGAPLAFLSVAILAAGAVVLVLRRRSSVN
ncbi:hypothetical protein GCG21_00370 [Pseudactinotalea sp. HY160]|uniref:glycosyl hydrolase family 95 catalytic domain-containing protein n=1 Tax=Pseudactinotalea sp. HY160 TaxID=2654490 RepID=UPI00128D4604|nr:glycoside hydrolase N-terminal domain-containing protein [Pseudactinotalea sp. HY160]MPV48487.1 hypothetical protein [Pseudactinotalea sp. HY160]